MERSAVTGPSAGAESGKRQWPDRHERDLHGLADDELISHLREARARQDLDGAKLALGVLVFGYMDHVRARVGLKVPKHAVDEVAGLALVSAVAGAFRGESIGEFRAWLHVIVDRRIADFHRTGRVEVVPLATEHDALGSLDDETDAVAVRNVIESALAELNEVHRAVIELYLFERLSASDTATEVARRFPTRLPVSPANVHKIAQRFRERVRATLGGDP